MYIENKGLYDTAIYLKKYEKFSMLNVKFCIAVWIEVKMLNCKTNEDGLYITDHDEEKHAWCHMI